MSENAAQAVKVISAGSGSYSESCSDLFEPDVVLPSQFLVPDETGLRGGERKLMAAILSDGIEAYISQCTLGNGMRRANNDAKEWVETRDYAYVFSFDLVCESLGIDPEYLRLGLGRYVEVVRERRQCGMAPRSVWKKIRRPRKQ